MRRQTQEILRRLGVRLILGTQVTSIDETGVQVTDRTGTTTRYAARTVLWAAGVQAAAFVDVFATALGRAQDASGRIAVNPDLSVPGRPNIWLVGDIAKVDNLPCIASAAIQAGRFAADQIHGAVTKSSHPKQRFRFRDTGTSVYLCRFNALVKVGPIRLSGFLGWLAWGAIHTRRLAARRNRIAVRVAWSLAVLSGQRRARTIPPLIPSHINREPSIP
jgi:NADH:ubiquinone reductase (H+-translocating)